MLEGPLAVTTAVVAEGLWFGDTAMLLTNSCCTLEGLEGQKLIDVKAQRNNLDQPDTAVCSCKSSSEVRYV
jgi:hypothetical protein